MNSARTSISSLRIPTTRGSCQQHQQGTDALPRGFRPGAFACPTHVVGKHLVKGLGAGLIESGDLTPQFLFDGVEHIFLEVCHDGFPFCVMIGSRLGLPESQVSFQLRGRLKMDGVKTELSGGFDICGRVVYEKALFRAAANPLKGEVEDGRVGLDQFQFA